MKILFTNLCFLQETLEQNQKKKIKIVTSSKVQFKNYTTMKLVINITMCRVIGFKMTPSFCIQIFKHKKMTFHKQKHHNLDLKIPAE